MLPYCRAPLGRVRARAKVSCIQVTKLVGVPKDFLADVEVAAINLSCRELSGGLSQCQPSQIEVCVGLMIPLRGQKLREKCTYISNMSAFSFYNKQITNCFKSDRKQFLGRII